MSLKCNPTPFDKIDYKSVINGELTANRELSAFFLVHGFIEAYLKEWLYYIGNKSKSALTKNLIEEIDKINFRSVLLLHLAIGSIDPKLYAKIDGLNKQRNKLAHELIKIDIKDVKVVNKLRKSAEMGLQICDEISVLYRSAIDKRAKEVEKLKPK